MADKDDEDKKADETNSSTSDEAKIGMVTWLIMIAVIALLSSSGFVLGRLLAGSSTHEPAEVSQEDVPQTETPPVEESTTENQDSWYHDLDSVVVNPDEPGATRFIRVGLILQMSQESNQEKTKELIEAKKPHLVNWLNLYFKGKSLDQMGNEKDLNRILMQIKDAFNEILFPEAKPSIEKILIREFNIQ